ncbi:MAG: PolC-type DNA polymerase III [Syntrophomonadaceae bacterium]|jgi:DNA polymerase-3 subunit alpha (Gram-positive type)
MNQNFYHFIQKHLPDNMACHWEDSYIENLQVNRTIRRWCIRVSVSQPIPARVIDSTASRLLSSIPSLNHLEILTRLKNPDKSIKKILDSRKDELSSSLFNNDKIIDQIPIKILSHGVDFCPHQKEQYQQIINDEVCNKLAAWFWQEYRLRILVRVLPAYDINEQRDIPVFIERQEMDLLNIPDDTAKKKLSFRKGKPEIDEDEGLLTCQIIPVSELQEGLKTAIVEGEIWDKSVSILKDGRQVFSYLVTDYIDTIVVKQFAEGDEHGLETYEWIRIKGSVRFDSYVREPVLFMESYLKVPKPLRQDNSEEKRIELHAHTKMSSMDGLTEVEALIKRAAEWGHEAIAITDHGCVQAFPIAHKFAKKFKIKVIYGVEAYLVETDRKERPYHIILLAQNQIGLRNLYQLISNSYLHNFYRHPKITRQELQQYREGIIIGSACEAGELYSKVINGESNEVLEQIADFYDYLELQPVGNNEFLIREGQADNIEAIQQLNKTVYELGKKLDKPVVATGDVHFLDPEHKIFRQIIQAGQGYDDVDVQAPLFFRTTEEMLNEFSYLGAVEAEEVVIKNPAVINARIESLQPVPEGFYPPRIDGAAEEITALSWETAKELYGNNLPDIVHKRLERELYSITHHGFSVLYLIAHKLVKKSNEDGYLVGSRGSVGSSLVAFLTGITEVNPLPPHWRCPLCGASIFINDSSVGCGADLPEKQCDKCIIPMQKDGFDIPFETFLGFEGDKVPDIDLNFSGEYQSRAHAYVEELFGRENVYRAGTISTIAEKTAYGFVKKFAEARGEGIKNSEINRRVRGIAGVRRTTGQHPGGLIVLPHDRNIMEFTPLQYPADKKESGVITTHFEYHAIGDQLVKLDILGHDDPTVIKELEDLTGIKANTISLSDAQTMQIFSGLESLGVTAEQIGSSVGTYGIPEFGTRFVRQMLEATRPTTFAELVRISGLSHGTDVWSNNAQNIIAEGIATLNEVICTRDDIMLNMIDHGVDKKVAFKIMEIVRKGNELKPDEVEIMKKQNIPDWYINSCQKIKYMFPKAHAVAYVTMAFRIAYFKVNYPLAFYASFFSIRAEDFDAGIILKGYEAVRNRIKEIERQGYEASPKDRKLIPILELAMEMYARGFKFYPVDIYRSQADKFLLEEEGLLIPFSSLPGVGSSAARGIITARDESDFISVEDFQQRTHLNKTAMEILRQYDCFEHLPDSTQISLFG